MVWLRLRMVGVIVQCVDKAMRHWIYVVEVDMTASLTNAYSHSVP